jgi:hypothetical protein
MQNNRRMAQIVGMGCAWLDQQAAALGAEDFASLQPEQREAIVERAEQAAPRTLPRYAHPDSWPSMGYAGPPQPRGFMDFAGPPGRGNE